MPELSDPRRRGALARAAAAAAPHAGAAPRAAAQALALRRRVRPGADGLRRRRPRRRLAAALVGGRAAGRTARRGLGAAWRSRRRASGRGDGAIELAVRSATPARSRSSPLTAARTSGRASRRACRCAGTCGRTGASGRSTARSASSTTPPGYHARRTSWRWSAGIGRARRGSGAWPGTWSTECTTHPAAASARVWVDGEPHEVEPQAFAADLSAVGGLRFAEWCAREDHTNRLVIAATTASRSARSRARSPAAWSSSRGTA